MVKLKYLGPASRADFSAVVGKPPGTERYVMVLGGEYEVPNADAEKLLSEPWRHGLPRHRFETLVSDSPDMPATRASVPASEQKEPNE